MYVDMLLWSYSLSSHVNHCSCELSLAISLGQNKMSKRKLGCKETMWCIFMISQCWLRKQVSTAVWVHVACEELYFSTCCYRSHSVVIMLRQWPQQQTTDFSSATFGTMWRVSSAVFRSIFAFILQVCAAGIWEIKMSLEAFIVDMLCVFLVHSDNKWQLAVTSVKVLPEPRFALFSYELLALTNLDF